MKQQIRWATVGCTAAGAALASAAPTTNRISDLILRVAWAVVVALVASRSRRWAIVVAATAVAATGTIVATILGVLAIGALVATRRRSRWFPARLVAGGLVANGTLWLAWPGKHGGTAALAAGIALLVGVTALRKLPRRWWLVPTIGLAAGTVASAGFVATMFQHRNAVTGAVAEAKAGLAAAERGDVERAQRAFGSAGAALRRVDEDLDRWWVRPVDAVPVVAQNAAAVQALARETAALARRGRETALAGRPEALRGPGGVDLGALEQLRTQLDALADRLQVMSSPRGVVQSPWLVGPVRSRADEVARRSAEASVAVAKAQRTATHAPWLLGAGRERRYFLAVTTTSELRGASGFIGNWGILTARDGQLELPRFGRIAELYAAAPYEFDVSPDWNRRWGQDLNIRRYPQNALSAPDLDSGAEAIRQIARQAGLGAIDGVIVVDPHALAGLLALTGDVTVDGLAAPLTAANAERVLLYEQYLDASNPQRIEVLSEVTQTIFDRLSQRLPDPGEAAQVLGPLATRKHVQMSVFDRDVDAYLADVGADQVLRPPGIDSLAVFTLNNSATKLDWFLRRSMTYDVRIDRATGEVRATLDVTLTNEAPADLQEPYFTQPHGQPPGVNTHLVSVYTPFTHAKGSVNGRRVDVGAAEELGHHVYDYVLDIAPGDSVTLRLAFSGGVTVPGDRYDLALYRQPTVAPDDVTVVVNGKRLRRGPLDVPVSLRTSVRRS